MWYKSTSILYGRRYTTFGKSLAFCVVEATQPLEKQIDSVDQQLHRLEENTKIVWGESHATLRKGPDSLLYKLHIP